jgi:hypothetical protein
MSAVAIFGPAFNVAGDIGVGPAVGVGFGVALGLATGDGVAGAALVVAGVGLGVVELEQATTARARNRVEPIRARRPVLTFSSPISEDAVSS